MTRLLLPLCLILLFSCNEKHGKMIAPVAAKWKTGDTFEVTIRKKSFQLSDTSGYVAFDSSQWVGKIGSNINQDSSWFNLLLDSSHGKINMGHPHKRKYIRNEPNFHNTTLNNEEHFTIGYSTKAYSPLILSDSYGVMIRDSSGTVLAQRDTIGTWHVYDCSKALEETYKILFNKYKQ